jgi:transposase-like protein
MKTFNNLIQVITHFADEQVATDHLIQLRWGGNVTCVHCGHDKIYTLKGATKRFKCAGCRKQFSATKGSIFENSPIALQTWFAAIYLITSHKKGISSHQLARDLSLTQKSAWFVLQRVRFALKSGSFNHSSGAVLQMDETFIGGKAKNKHKSVAKFADNKTPVIGMIEQGGKVIAEKSKDVKAESLMPFIAKHVNKTDSTIVTDSWRAYDRLNDMGYNHITVNHMQGEYVWNGYHTNGIENFWSIFKRGIIGIYHQVSDKHLDKYIDEFEFRYNTRKCTEAERFDKMLTRCNVRLTYAQLIANEN